MELNDLIAEKIEWNPKAGDTTLNLQFRLFSIEDEAWLKRTYPGQRLSQVFENLETAEIVRIAFHQLEVASKKVVMGIKFMDVDEEGKDVEVAKTGPEKVGALISGHSGVIEILNLLLKTRGLSLPLLERIVDQVGIDGLKNLTHGKK